MRFDYGLIKDYIYSSDKEKVEEIIDNFNDEAKKEIFELKIEIAELQAKIYAYEKIIANSNFKAVLKKVDKVNGE
jgi:hypothetical protein